MQLYVSCLVARLSIFKNQCGPEPKGLPTPALKGGLVPTKLQLTMHSDWNDYVKKKVCGTFSFVHVCMCKVGVVMEVGFLKLRNFKNFMGVITQLPAPHYSQLISDPEE